MLKQIDNRKNGVTIDEEFIQILENKQFLTSPHLIFFQRVFYKYFSNQRKIFLVDCYFFTEFMPKLTSQLSSNLIDFEKINNIKQQIEDRKTIQSNIISNSINQKRNQLNQESQVIEKQNKDFVFEIISINQIKQVDEGIFKISQLENLLSQQTLNDDYQKGNSIMNYDYAYFPINLGNFHWISVLVYFTEGIIIYQDSLNGYNAGIIAAIQRIIKYKCAQNIDWKIQRNTPMQIGSLDCGVFTLYALFFLYTRGELIKNDSYTQTFISRVRQNFVTLARAELKHMLNAEQVINIVNQL